MEQKPRRGIGTIVVLGIALLLNIALVATVILMPLLQPESTPPSLEGTGSSSTPSSAPTEPPTDPPTEPPTEPPIVKEATATLSAIGDMLMHPKVYNSAIVDSEGNYNMDSIFQYFLDYPLASDFAVANLETTLAGLNNGYGYMGFPLFNCPDGVVDALKTAGFDMLLTANNHTYDTQSIGISRSQQVITEKGLQYLGTKQTADEPNYLIQDLNGIRIGMLCYTYEDDAKPDIKTLNGHELSAADAALVNSFDYYHLNLFYTEMQANMAALQAENVDAVVMFIHWGNEYNRTHNSWQKTIAQALCDMGVDVIIGGHPHVLQPVELLTSAVDANHKTVCIYSLGNAVSNQRIEYMRLKTGHTEDGCMFTVTFAKYSDGTVLIESAELLPTWVNCHSTSGRLEYNILPLDKEIEDWKTQFNLTDETLAAALASYDRTIAIVGPGLQAVNDYLSSQPTPA